MITAKLNRRYRDFPYTSSPNMPIVSPIINIIHKNEIFVTTYDTEIFTTLKILCASPIHPFPHQALVTSNNFIISTVLLFPKCNIVGTIPYVAF